jgi:LacI family transcriptional regulator
MDNAKSIHARIVAALRDGIREGRYKNRLPSEAQIAAWFGCARKTAVRAMEQLAWEGIAVRRKGKGTFVSREFRRRQCGIGLIVMSYSEMFPIVCQEISRLCQVNGQVLMLGQIAKGDAKSRAKQARDLTEKFADQGVEGVIFQPVGFLPDADAISANIVETFTRKGIPVVLVDGDIVPVPERSACDTVEIDNFEAGYRLARHILEVRPKGRIVYCTRPFWPHSNGLRWQGVRSAAADLGGAAERILCEPDNAAAIERRLRSRKTAAIICGYDALAVKVAAVLKRLGKRVPDDIMLAGFDDVGLASAMTPALTTIHQPCEDISRAAFDMLMRRIADPNAPRYRILLAAPLVVRESTMAFAAKVNGK